jgi:hypothetical protein
MPCHPGCSARGVGLGACQRRGWTDPRARNGCDGGGPTVGGAGVFRAGPDRAPDVGHDEGRGALGARARARRMPVPSPAARGLHRLAAARDRGHGGLAPPLTGPTPALRMMRWEPAMACAALLSDGAPRAEGACWPGQGGGWSVRNRESGASANSAGASRGCRADRMPGGRGGPDPPGPAGRHPPWPPADCTEEGHTPRRLLLSAGAARRPRGARRPAPKTGAARCGSRPPTSCRSSCTGEDAFANTFPGGPRGAAKTLTRGRRARLAGTLRSAGPRVRQALAGSVPRPCAYNLVLRERRLPRKRSSAMSAPRTGEPAGGANVQMATNPPSDLAPARQISTGCAPRGGADHGDLTTTSAASTAATRACCRAAVGRAATRSSSPATR